jgi:hypothetical protein
MPRSSAYINQADIEARAQHHEQLTGRVEAER